MTGIQRRAVAFCVLTAVTAILCGASLVGRDSFPPLQTNILALLPATERNPLAEHAVQRLADAAGDRAMFLVGHATPAVAHEAAERFAERLRATASFRRVYDRIPDLDASRLIALYAPYRFSLLDIENRASLERGDFDAADRLRKKLYSPWRSGMATSPGLDPFGLLDEWLAALGAKTAALAPENGRLVARDRGVTWVMVTAELAGSAHDVAVQRATTAATHDAEQALRKGVPGAEVMRTGVVFYAAAARHTAEREVDVIGLGSLAGIVLLFLVVFRSLSPLLLGLLSIAVGISAAVAATVYIHGEIHIVTLVFGASLIGEAIDYSIQYFAARVGAGDGWDPADGLRAVLPGLSAGLATSLLGYAALTLTPFPALKQIAVFAFAGLIAAWATVVLLLPALLRRPSRLDAHRVLAVPRAMLGAWRSHVGRGAALGLAATVVAASIPGWAMLSSDDDIRQLIERPRELVAQETEIRRLTGFGGGSQFFLVQGDTPASLLENEERLTARLRAAIGQRELDGYRAMSDFVPSPATQRRNRALLSPAVFGDPGKVSRLLASEGLRDDAVQGFVAAYETSAGALLTLEHWLASPLSVPLRHLWLGRVDGRYASMVVPQGTRTLAVLETAARDLPGIVLVDKPGSIARLFRDYRQSGGIWLAFATALVWLILAARYGRHDAAVVVLPIVVAMGASLAVLGYLGMPVTVFNLLGLCLVLGVGVNYSIFLYEGGDVNPAAFVGVALSAATTLLSFGLLALSTTPALRNFGITLWAGISVAGLLSPIVLSLRRHARCA